jgi:hypothetical protein
MPADVSFENCSILEKDVDAVGTGCFQQFYASHHIGHHPGTSPTSVGPPDNDTSGSRVSSPDQIDCDASSCDGGWSWSIPVLFQVGSGALKQFTTVDQVVAITAAGSATISKAGGTNTSALNDTPEKDPLFD